MSRNMRSIVELVFIVAIPCALCSSTHTHARTRTDSTQDQIERYLAALHSSAVDRPTRVLVELPIEMPRRDIVAHTTADIDPLGNTRGCVLHFTAESIRSQSIVAHEVCHCVLDYEYLGQYGYRHIVSLELVSRFEHRAQKCADWITKSEQSDGVESGMRMAGVVPSFQ